MSQPLSWEFVARDRMSEVLDKLGRAAEKLDRSLTKTGEDGQRMGSDLGEQEHRVQELEDKLSQLSHRTTEAGDRMGMLGHAAASFLGNMAANAAYAFAGAVEQGTKSIIELGVQTAASNEQAEISFEVLLGSAAKAQDFLAKIKHFAAVTPFDLPGLRDAGSKLLAVGVEAKDVIPIMTALGNATAGMGTGAEGIQRAVLALQQMKQAGAIHAGDMLQLTEAGIPAWDALAAKMHKTVAQVKTEMGKPGSNIDPQLLFSGIEGQMGAPFQRLKGMMDKQSATLVGIWSTFKDDASQQIGAAFDQAIPGLKKGLLWADQAIPSLIAKVESFGKRLAGIFAGGGIGKFVDDLMHKFKPEFINNAHAAVERFFDTIQRNKPEILAATKAIMATVGWLIANSPRLLDGMSAAIEMISFCFDSASIMCRGFMWLLRAEVDAAAAAWGWIPGLGPKLKAAAAGFDHFADQVNHALDSVHSRTVSINVQTVTLDANAKKLLGGAGSNRYISQVPIQARAAGGPVAPGVLLVGEEGPELWYTNTPGYVQPLGGHGAHTASGKATATAPAEVEATARWVGDGSALVRALMAAIQIEIKGRHGGSVSRALGVSGVV